MRILPAIALLALLMCGTAGAIDTQPPLADPVLQKRYEDVIRQLRCLKCQNETIADSGAPIAADLRAKARLMVMEGRSDAEIYKFMTDRYGDFVLYKPPLEPRTWLLWAAPGLFVLIGLIAAASIIMRRARVASLEPADVEADPT